MRCPNSTSNPTRPAHTVAPSRPQAKAVSVALVLNTHQRTLKYVDERVRAVQRDLNRSHAQAWREETRKMRVTFIERIAFVLIGAIVVVMASRLDVFPRFAIAGIAIAPEIIRRMPDIVREAIELFRRI